MIATNNVFNIRVNPNNRWLGSKGQIKGFVCFDSVAFAVRAAYIILRSYKRKGVVSIHDVVSRWAPPHENPTTNYILFVQMACGAKSCFDDFWPYRYLIIKAFAWYETNTSLDVSEIRRWVKYFKFDSL